MCGIIGFANKKNCIELLLSGMKTLKGRGRDFAGVLLDNRLLLDKSLEKIKNKVASLPGSPNFCFGHLLHSVVSFVPEPIVDSQNKIAITANCEIYNWEDLSEKHNVFAENDVELILNLFKKNLAGNSDIGNILNAVEKTINELDGVFAFALRVSDWIVIARDILGVKPLWYINKGFFAFASERKALSGLGYPKELNPRFIAAYNIKEGIESIKKGAEFNAEKSMRMKKREFFELSKTTLTKKDIITL